MTDTITQPNSAFTAGQWRTAHWSAEIVDPDTGELIVTAAVVGPPPNDIIVLRLTSDLVRDLRKTVATKDPAPTPSQLPGTPPPVRFASPPAWMPDEIEEAYDPEHDAFPVTWTDMRLLRAVKDAALYAEALELRVRTLEQMAFSARISALEKAATPAIANREWMDATESVLAGLEKRLAVLDEWREVAEYGERVLALELSMVELNRRSAPAAGSQALEDRIGRLLSALQEIANLEAVDPDGIRWTYSELFRVARQIAHEAINAGGGKVSS